MHRSTITVRLTQDVKHKHSHAEFVRVMLNREVHGYAATSVGDQGNWILASMSRAYAARA
jgi:molybdopterin biosynthesis enzyme